jgi:hypothetical protein
VELDAVVLAVPPCPKRLPPAPVKLPPVPPRLPPPPVMLPPAPEPPPPSPLRRKLQVASLPQLLPPQSDQAKIAAKSKVMIKIEKRISVTVVDEEGSAKDSRGFGRRAWGVQAYCCRLRRSRKRGLASESKTRLSRST